MRRFRSLLVAIAILFVAVACVSEGRSVEVHDQSKSLWASSEEFYYENEDTLSMREIAVVLRYDRKDVVDTLSLNIVTISPDSLVLSENMTLRIPRLGDMRPAEQSFPYRRGVVLQRKGEYRFRLTPGMKADGVGSVGLLIANQSEE